MDIKIEETPPSEVLFPLWQSALGNTWPLSQVAFLSKIGNKSATTFKATDEGKLVGMVTVNGGNITVILVSPDYQRKGIGSLLLETALNKIRESGHSRVVAGQGNGYFWPGVPLNLMGAMQFLKKKGWVEDELVTDMACDLTNYSVPEDIKQKIAVSTDVEIRLSTATDADGILAFEKKCFPEWEQTATKAIANKKF
ncbi:MAG: hypothetical protein QG623_252, partial [Patescibacteria group bacterium]|nr:hypothetical protein [Patescibacteria group bacterium]